MDASTILPMCSWILAELVRFATKKSIDTEEAKKIIGSLIERKYPIFEEIDDRVYVDHKKFKSANECGLLILYKVYPNRIAKNKFTDCLKRHNFKQSAIKFDRLSNYIDIDKHDNILLRATGRQKAEEILNKFLHFFHSFYVMNIEQYDTYEEWIQKIKESKYKIFDNKKDYEDILLAAEILSCNQDIGTMGFFTCDKEIHRSIIVVAKEYQQKIGHVLLIN